MLLQALLLWQGSVQIVIPTPKPALVVNGVDIATLGLTIAEAPGWLDAPPRDIPTAPIIGRAGAKALSVPTEGPRQINLTGTIRGKTVVLARNTVDQIKLALLADELSLTFADHADRHVYAYLKTLTTRILQGAQGPFVQEALAIDITLQALNPLSYDNDLTSVGFGSANRLALGTGPVRPLITITGAATNPVITLRNKTGVAMASMTLTVTDAGGDTLSIDMDSKTIKKNGVSALSSLTAGDFFSIDPLDQANYGGAGPYIDVSSGAGTVNYWRTWR